MMAIQEHPTRKAMTVDQCPLAVLVWDQVAPVPEHNDLDEFVKAQLGPLATEQSDRGRLGQA